MLARRSLLATLPFTVAAAAAAQTTGAAPTAGTASGSGLAATEVLLVMEKNQRGLGWYDPASGRRIGGVALPEFPHEMVLDADARHVFVGHYGLFNSAATGTGGSSVLVVDVEARRVVHTVDLAPFNRIHGLAIDRHDRLYALSEGRDTLLVVNKPTESASPDAAVATGGIKTHLFSLTRDGERAFVCGLLSSTVSLVRPHDAAAAPVVIRTGTMPEGNCLSPDEKTLYVGNRRSGTLVAVDTDSMKVRDSKQVGGDPLRVYAMPDGRLLLTNLERRTLTMLTPAMEEITTMAFDSGPTAVSLHPRRPVAYVSLFSDRMAVVDLDARRVVNEFPTRQGTDVSRLLHARPA